MGTQKYTRSRALRMFGFSLIEVNMAVFVMAVGIIGMAALYPLGLRESIQSTADLKQSMFADVVLGAAVAAASSPNVTWTVFKDIVLAGTQNDSGATPPAAIPKPIDDAVKAAVNVFNKGASVQMVKDQNYQFFCFRVPRPRNDNRRDDDSPVMGFIVVSLDMDTSSMSANDVKRLLGNQQVYYAEALYQGVQ